MVNKDEEYWKIRKATRDGIKDAKDEEGCYSCGCGCLILIVVAIIIWNMAS